MDDFDDFAEQLRVALVHLYAPNYLPPPHFCKVLGCHGADPARAVQQKLLHAIEALKPPVEAPPGVRSERLYRVLTLRYAQALTQEAAAEEVGLTARHLRREQQEAIQVLARQLWQQRPSAAVPVSEQVEEFRAQVRQELIALQVSAPGAISDLNEVLHGALTVGQALVARRGVQLVAEPAAPGLAAAIHPSALRQILITAIEKLTQPMSSGRIALRAAHDREQVALAVTASPLCTNQLPDSTLIREIVSLYSGGLQVQSGQDEMKIQVHLPLARKVSVLVIDDNTDLVHFYRRYVANTRYEIIHAGEGEGVFAVAKECRPALIVLDVMLPDTDGWELLVQLRTHPATQTIPVIVCSVVRREELAAALDAALYVAKPVRRQQFIQALDQVLAQVESKGQPDAAPHARSW